MRQNQDVQQTPIPGLPEPVDVVGSACIVCRWVAAGLTVGVFAFAHLGGTTGAAVALACLLAGTWIGHEASDAVSDSDAWRARDARRRGVGKD